MLSLAFSGQSRGLSIMSIIDRTLFEHCMWEFHQIYYLVAVGDKDELIRSQVNRSKVTGMIRSNKSQKPLEKF